MCPAPLCEASAGTSYRHQKAKAVASQWCCQRAQRRRTRMPKLAAEPISILLIDDHVLFRESVTRLLNLEPGLEVVAHCGSIDEGLEALARGRIDIVLLDFDLGGPEGTEFVRLSRRRGFTGKILVVTAGVSQGDAAQLIRNGIAGIFMKNQSADLLAQGIRDVMAGKVWFDQ